MNKTLIILFIFLSVKSLGQPVVNRAGPANTVQDANWFAQRSMRLPAYDDTSQANTLYATLDSCGKMFYNRATNSIWYRACNPKRWLPIQGGAGEIDVFLIAGQSNAVGNSGSPDSAFVPKTGTAFQFYNKNITAAVEPIGNSDGSAWGAFAVTYWKLTGRRVCFVPAAVNGSSMASAAQVGFGTWDTTGTLYSTSVLKIDSAMTNLVASGYSPVFKGVLWCQGETDGDGINRGIITQNIYSAAFAKLIKNYRVAYGKGISFNISRIGFRTDTIQTGYLAVQNAQAALSNPDSLTNMVYWNAPFFPQRGLMVDIYHYDQSGYNEMGRIMAEEYVNSTSNNFQTQAGNIYYRKGNLGIGDIIPTSPIHIYNKGVLPAILVQDSINSAVVARYVNKQNGTLSSAGIWLENSVGLRSQIAHVSPSSISGNDILVLNTSTGIALCAETTDIDLSTGTGTSNLPAKSRFRIKTDGDIGIGPAVDPVASALVEMVSTTKGLLIPRMTAAQRIAISSPATSLLVYDLDSAKHCYYNGAAWICYGSGGGGVASSWNASMAVSADLSSDYVSNLNNNDWNLQNTADFTIHSDAGGTVRLKLSTTQANLFAPNGTDGFIANNDSIKIIGVDESASTGLYFTLINGSTGALTRIASSSVGGASWNGITNPTGDQTLTFDAGESSTWTNSNTTEDLFTANSSTVTTSSFFSLNRTSTALAAGNNIMELVSSGANGTSSITATGLSISVTNTGTSSTNVGLSVIASGATTNTAIAATGNITGTGNAILDGNVRLNGSSSGFIVNNRANPTAAVITIYGPDGNGINFFSSFDAFRFKTDGEFLANTATDNGAFTIQNNGSMYNSGNILIGGTSVATSATTTLHLFNGTIPSASVTDGVLMYSEDVASSAELKARDEAGNIATLTPHNFTGIPGGRSEEMSWAFYSERDGKYVNVDMLKLARLVEKITGEKIVYIGDTKVKPNPINK